MYSLVPDDSGATEGIYLTRVAKSIAAIPYEIRFEASPVEGM